MKTNPIGALRHEIVRQLNAKMQTVIDDPKAKKRMLESGIEPGSRSSRLPGRSSIDPFPEGEGISETEE